MTTPVVTTPVDDELWSAIGDPTRRQLLDLLLAAGTGTATSLSERLPVSRQAVSKHLVVLDRAGLVRGETAGRERQYRIDDQQFERALAQLHAVSTAWDGRLRRIKRLAEAIRQSSERSSEQPSEQPSEQSNEKEQ